MDRQEKLHLSNDEAWGCCFVQGVFVRFFERSLYHFNRTARPLKPMLERVKGGGKIVYGGMPIQVFERLVAQGTKAGGKNGVWLALASCGAARTA